MKTIDTPRTYSDVITVNVDVQNDFALPTGSLSVRDGEAVIEPLNQLNDWTRDKLGKVIFTQDWHPRQTAHFAENGGIWPVHCVQDTPGADLHDALRVDINRDERGFKGMSLQDDGYSGLEAIINEEMRIDDVETIIKYAEREARAHRFNLAVIIGGLATDFCVKATVLDALRATNRNYTDVIVATNAVRAVDLQPGDGDAALQAMLEAGALAMTTDEIIKDGIVIDASRLER